MIAFPRLKNVPEDWSAVAVARLASVAVWRQRYARRTRPVDETRGATFLRQDA
jgi:hypothetical protein